MLQLLEERLDALQGAKQFDVTDLCLFPNIVIPPKFELPAFDKYGGTTSPKSHLTMYCRKMALHAYDDALLIHFFQEILTGATLIAHIQPPLSENEMATMFIDTLYPPFYEKMVGNVVSNFSDLVLRQGGLGQGGLHQVASSSSSMLGGLFFWDATTSGAILPVLIPTSNTEEEEEAT
ncbi:hypothetical protein CR513_29420, partial [Mucuna pruriens]